MTTQLIVVFTLGPRPLTSAFVWVSSQKVRSLCLWKMFPFDLLHLTPNTMQVKLVPSRRKRGNEARKDAHAHETQLLDASPRVLAPACAMHEECTRFHLCKTRGKSFHPWKILVQGNLKRTREAVVPCVTNDALLTCTQCPRQDKCLSCLPPW